MQWFKSEAKKDSSKSLKIRLSSTIILPRLKILLKTSREKNEHNDFVVKFTARCSAVKSFEKNFLYDLFKNLVKIISFKCPSLLFDFHSHLPTFPENCNLTNNENFNNGNTKKSLSAA